jgi:hypothetical protein
MQSFYLQRYHGVTLETVPHLTKIIQLLEPSEDKTSSLSEDKTSSPTKDMTSSASPSANDVKPAIDVKPHENSPTVHTRSGNVPIKIEGEQNAAKNKKRKTETDH